MVENHGLNQTQLTPLDQPRTAGEGKCDPLDKTDRIELYKGAGLATREDKVRMPAEFGCLKITGDAVEPSDDRGANMRSAFVVKLAIELAKEAAKGAVGTYVVHLLSGGSDKKPEEKNVTATETRPIGTLGGNPSASAESKPAGSKDGPFVQASETVRTPEQQPRKTAPAPEQQTPTRATTK